jgi:DNA polymerase-3 subunit gamma/tau
MAEVLYRKYRPQNFTEVIGQEQVVEVLKGAIKSKNLSHAYLFAGSRGTGKTSIARIFADQIGVTKNDLYEIDAASQTSVDDIRLLKEGVSSMPFESPYKVYILDEVHMLSKSAFNAFLKLLEEPPKHVIFILATTELHKLPDTVISRCQVFQFKKPTQKALRELVIEIAKKEGVSIKPAAADLVALLGDGSFRDTLGMLQKVMQGAGGKTVTAEDVEVIAGAPKHALVSNFLKAIVTKDIELGLSTLNESNEANTDMAVFATLLLQKLRAMLLLRFAPTMKKTVEEELSEVDAELLTTLAKDKRAVLTADVLVAFLEATERIRFSAIPSLPLELALIKISNQ